jgi:hypothetical protein
MATQPPTPPGEQPITADDLPAVRDLAALAAALPAHGLAAQLGLVSPPYLILTCPATREPQHVYAEGEFFIWHNTTGHAPFGFRHHPPTLTAHAASLVMQAVILGQPGQDQEPGTQ